MQMEEMFGRIGQTNWATVSMYVLARFEAVSQEGDVKVDGEPPEYLPLSRPIPLRTENY